MKKIFLLISILLSVWGAHAQQYILLQFSGQDKIPVISNDEAGKKYTVTDKELDSIFNSYNITKFIKAFTYVHLVNHPNAEPLDRVYQIEVSENINMLFANLQALKSPALSGSVYLLNPPQTLTLPDDYTIICGLPCGLPGCSAGLQNDLINAPAAWNITTGNPAIRVGMTDLNFRRTHEEIIGKIVNDFAAPFNPAAGSHGTITASLAAGNTNNGIGIASIGYNCKLDLCDLGYDGILQAAMNGAQVINCSWHDGSCGYISYYQEYIDMIYATYHPVIVAAAGNGNAAGSCGLTADHYPASYNHVISVSSVGFMAEIGACTYGWKDVHDGYPGNLSFTYTHNSAVDLCAPGVRVIGAHGSADNAYTSQGYGTSFAAPMVSGTAALILSVNPSLQPDDVEAILKCTARDLYEISYNIPYLNILGAGRIDAGQAVQLAQTWVPGTGINQQPAPTDIRWFDILSDGINTTEVENTCNANNYPGMCNIGYRLEVVSSNPGAIFKWLTFYSENGANVTNSIKYGSSITLMRGIDYPNSNVTGGSLKACVRINDCLPSIYYSEDRNSSCFGTECNTPCPGDITITGNYSTPITESATWVKSSGQTIIASTISVKLDANPVNGYIEFAPASNSDYFLSEPDVSGQFIATPYNGCVNGAPSFTKKQETVPSKILDKNENNPKNNVGISIFPNPGDGLFYIKHPANIKQMFITDSHGKLLLKRSNIGAALTQINLRNMPNGIYMLHIEGIDKVLKIIKQ